MPSPVPSHLIEIASLPARKELRFALSPTPQDCAALAQALGVEALRKLRVQGKLIPQGQKDWRLRADLAASVVQPCAITLVPVTTRIEEEIHRIYMAQIAPPPPGETQMDLDADIDPLPQTLDLYEVVLEALRLAVPDYVRAPGAELGSVVHTEPGQAPLTDDDVKPFAGLAALRAQMSQNNDEEPSQD